MVPFHAPNFGPEPTFTRRPDFYPLVFLIPSPPGLQALPRLRRGCAVMLEASKGALLSNVLPLIVTHDVGLAAEINQLTANSTAPLPAR